MKYLLIQLAAALPLLGLTVWTLTRPVSPADVSAPAAAAVDVAPAELECKETASLVEKGLPIAKQFLAANLLGTKPLAFTDEPDASLQETVASWKKAESVREMAGEVCNWQAKAARRAEQAQEARKAGLTESELETTQAEIKDWQEFLATRQAYFVEKGIGADVVFGAIQDRCKVLSTHQERLHKDSEIAAAWSKALKILRSESLEDSTKTVEIEKFRHEKAKECRDFLLLEPLASANLGENAMAKINYLRERAKYRVDWYGLFSKERLSDLAKPSNDNFARSDLIQRELIRMKNFLDTRKPPKMPLGSGKPLSTLETLIAQEIKDHELAQTRCKQLRIVGSLAILANTNDFEPLLKESESIVRNQLATRVQKEQARKAVLDWLKTRGLPKIEAPPEIQNPNMREAIIKVRQRKIGTFKLLTDVSPWQFRSAESDREVSIPRDQVIVQPGRPYYARFAEEYEKERKTVLPIKATRDEWMRVARRLQEMQNELAKYRTEWVVPGGQHPWDEKCRDWNCEKLLLTTQQMLEHWDRYQSLFRDDVAELTMP